MSPIWGTPVALATSHRLDNLPGSTVPNSLVLYTQIMVGPGVWAEGIYRVCEGRQTLGTAAATNSEFVNRFTNWRRKHGRELHSSGSIDRVFS